MVLVGELLEDAKERDGKGAESVAEADQPDEADDGAESGRAEGARVAEDGNHGDEGDHRQVDGHEQPNALLGGEVEEAERDRDGGEEEVEGVAEEAVLGEADVVSRWSQERA